MDIDTGIDTGKPWRRALLVRVVTTLAAWVVAYLLVLTLLIVAGNRLQSLPPAADALIFTGLLVPLMGNLVMPVLGRQIGRRLAGTGTVPGDRNG